MELDGCNIRGKHGEKFWTKLKVLVFAEIKDACTVLKQVKKKN